MTWGRTDHTSKRTKCYREITLEFLTPDKTYPRNQPILLFELTIIVNIQVPLNLPVSLILEH